LSNFLKAEQLFIQDDKNLLDGIKREMEDKYRSWSAAQKAYSEE